MANRNFGPGVKWQSTINAGLQQEDYTFWHPTIWHHETSHGTTTDSIGGNRMLQEIEQYKGRWILYGLGNFVFNSMGRYKKIWADPPSQSSSKEMLI